MNTKHEGPPGNGAGKRRQIESASLSSALEEQKRRDAVEPPASLLSTMGAIRLLGDLILERFGRGWTDPMLVVWLRDLGVEISPETLRVYRGRLNNERSGAPAAERGPDRQTTASASVAKAHDREDNRGTDHTQTKIGTASIVGQASTAKDTTTERPRKIAFDDRV